MKFTKKTGETHYQLTQGDFYHNHDLSTPVLDPDILRELDLVNPNNAKPAQVRKEINQKYQKDISYAQIAYELNKRKQRNNNTQGSQNQLSYKQDKQYGQDI